MKSIRGTLPQAIKDLREKFRDVSEAIVDESSGHAIDSFKVKVLGTFPVLPSTDDNPYPCPDNEDYTILKKRVIDKLGKRHVAIEHILLPLNPKLYSDLSFLTS